MGAEPAVILFILPTHMDTHMQQLVFMVVEWGFFKCEVIIPCFLERYLSLLIPKICIHSFNNLVA